VGKAVIERRLDPVDHAWRLMSTGRQKRTFLPSESECPLCPSRDGALPTEIPRDAFEIAVFDNKFPPLIANAPATSPAGAPYLTAPAVGAAEVIVYTDDHDATLAQLGRDRIEALIHVWADRYAELGSRPDVQYVFIFENRGAEVGVTLHHPHGQIYAYPELPARIARRLERARLHLAANRTCVHCDIVARERADRVRVVAQTESFAAFVPFAPRFPYEVHVVSRRHATSLLDLTDPERASLADLLASLLGAYDALFGFPLPYVMSVHQSPTDDGANAPISHFQIEFAPIHRTSTKLKYIAGSELGAGAFVLDARPEDTARELRATLAG
jgi:UDPglucose--hexose-1-phosphate uridylyltransferase